MLIINGKILPMEGKTIENGYVQTKGEVIKELGKMEQAPSPGKGEEVLDVKGAWVMPGLIDAHCHVGIMEEKRGTAGDDCNEATDPITPAVRAVDGVNPMDCVSRCDYRRDHFTDDRTGSANVDGRPVHIFKEHTDGVSMKWQCSILRQ